MEGIELPPLAPSLMESLRALGYTVEAAIADLIDNSIAASATAVDVSFAVVPEPFVAVLDNGMGMDDSILVEAMRFGSRDPRDSRSELDLGRFGLGLKTASLSQCRCLTVISMHGGELACAQWDLDECDRRGTWWLQRPDPSSVFPDLVSRLQEQGQGTLVLWRRPDRLLPDHLRRDDADLDKALSGVAEHLGFIFHRFLSNRSPSGVAITVNSRPVPRFDPFLEGHPRGQVLHEEKFWIEGNEVVVTPFVLPFPSRLSPADLELAGGRERVKSGHGFYVYRGKRLVVPGGWFRIVPADDLVRLARLRVDVPIELDHLWKIDIRKTAVEPPPQLRSHLKRIVGDAASRSRKVYEFRGKSDPRRQGRPIWVRQSLRDGAVTWTLDRQHPAIVALSTGLPEDTDRLFRLIEEALPLHDIHIHLANDVKVAEAETPIESELENLARRFLKAFENQPDTFERLASTLPNIEPFSRYPDVTRNIIERISSWT